MAIRLEKTGDTHKIDLTKRGDNPQEEILVNLNWSRKKGFWASLTGRNVDLGLGCWYKLQDGATSCIDGLQFAHELGGDKNQNTKQGCYVQKPWIWHSGNDRSGAVSEGENMLINLQGVSDLKRMTIYCFICKGAAKWAEQNVVVTIKVPGNEDIVVEMGKQYSAQKFCAIAEILFDTDNSMTVEKLVTFHDGHGDCDKAYHWNMQKKYRRLPNCVTSIRPNFR
jgi:tellurite resistance protein TerA